VCVICALPQTITPQGPELIERLFLFSALWAFGATAVTDKNNDYRKKFSAAWQAAFKVCACVRDVCDSDSRARGLEPGLLTQSI
jgi:hypothetical protein